MLQLSEYPKAQALAFRCSQEFEALRNQGWAAFQAQEFDQWPESINTNQKWLVSGVRAGSMEVRGGAALFPALDRIVSGFNDLVTTAGYSALLPGALITPHKGYTKDVLRLHFGLMVPDGDCGIKIDGRDYSWKARLPLLFDDTLEHSAWNRTDVPRLILLFDLNKVYL